MDCYTSKCSGRGLVYQYISCLSLLCFPILFYLLSSSSSFCSAHQQISSFPGNILAHSVISNLDSKVFQISSWYAMHKPRRRKNIWRWSMWTGFKGLFIDFIRLSVTSYHQLDKDNTWGERIKQAHGILCTDRCGRNMIMGGTELGNFWHSLWVIHSLKCVGRCLTWYWLASYLLNYICEQIVCT